MEKILINITICIKNFVYYTIESIFKIYMIVYSEWSLLLWRAGKFFPALFSAHSKFRLLNFLSDNPKGKNIWFSLT